MPRKAQTARIAPVARPSQEDDLLDSSEPSLQDLDDELGGFLTEAAFGRQSRQMSSDELTFN